MTEPITLAEIAAVWRLAMGVAGVIWAFTGKTRAVLIDGKPVGYWGQFVLRCFALDVWILAIWIASSEEDA